MCFRFVGVAPEYFKFQYFGTPKTPYPPTPAVRYSAFLSLCAQDKEAVNLISCGGKFIFTHEVTAISGPAIDVSTEFRRPSWGRHTKSPGPGGLRGGGGDVNKTFPRILQRN
jgi:hypothetical protein